MCRFLAYLGDPVLMETLLVAPSHSLIHQSLNAAEAKQRTNGDGFGLGWYGERTEPGLYRDLRPAWSDENLRSITAQCGNEYWRARLGIGHPGDKALVHAYVLNDFAKAEMPWVEDLCDAMADAADELMREALGQSSVAPKAAPPPSIRTTPKKTNGLEQRGRRRARK